MYDFQDLRVWRSAIDRGANIYELVKRLPPEERDNLAPQLRRAANSIHSNIAEGHGRGRRADFARCLRIARASTQESHSQLLFAIRVRHFTNAELAPTLAECDRVARMISALVRSLGTRRDPGDP